MPIDKNEYNNKIKVYKELYQPLDEYLYKLCNEFNGYNSKAHIYAKLAIIGRTYATGIERRVRGANNGRALDELTDFFHNNDILNKIITETLNLTNIDNDVLTQVISLHSRFTVELSNKTEGAMLRSFASKYLHFHNPIVPPYDAFALREAKELTGNSWKTLRNMQRPDGADNEYYKYVLRFWLVFQKVRDSCDDSASVKEVDFYLWDRGRG